MEVRIGVVHTPKEISLEVEFFDQEIELTTKALADDDGVLWITGYAWPGGRSAVGTRGVC